MHSIPPETGTSRWLVAFSVAAAFGVPVFFTLSAFLITELLTLEKRSKGSLDVKAFYVRRILRIWPLYFLILGSAFSVSWIHYHGLIPVSALVAFLFFMGNWYTGKHGYLSSGAGPLWSISVEEQFYIIWPLFVRVLSRRIMGVMCILAWVGSQIAVILLCLNHVQIATTLWTNSLVQLQYLALGAGVSLLLNGSTPAFRVRTRLLMVILAAIILYAPVFIFIPVPFVDVSSVGSTYPMFLFAGAAVTILLLALLGCSSLESWHVLRYLGKISYGLYVFHGLCLGILERIAFHLHVQPSSFTSAVLGLASTIAVAAVSYRYFESPFLRLKGRFEVVKSRSV
jgi:peptidoglycan/LPS O-acetylase OafA/YrhL